MTTVSTTMRGLALDLSSPLHVQLREDLALPTPKSGEVLVRVTHASVNGHEFELAQNRLVRALAWLSRAPGEVRTGLEFAGVVASRGKDFRAGERVMGYIDIVAGWHPHADYVAIPEAYLAPIPAGLSLAHASTLPMGALTALEAVRGVARVQPGHRVLVVGASGGVGVMAVQIVRILGATTTAVASRRHHEQLERLGATHCVDYRETPIPTLQGPFDAILDFSSTLRLPQISHLLAPKGVFVPGDPMRNFVELLGSRQARWLMVDRGDGPRLREIGAWVEQGRLEAVVGEVFELERWEQAVARSHERGRIGRTVLQFEDPAKLSASAGPGPGADS